MDTWGRSGSADTWGRSGSVDTWGRSGSADTWGRSASAGTAKRIRGAGTGGRCRGAGTGLGKATTGGLAILSAGGLAILSAGRLGFAAGGGVNFPTDGGLTWAANGGGLALATGGSGLGRAADGGLVLTRARTLPRHRKTFSPTQSCGVWEVHGVVVTGPEPEQVEDGCVMQFCHRGEPAEFLGILHEGEIVPDKGEEAGGAPSPQRGKKQEKQKLLKKRKTKRGRRSAAYFCFGPVFCHNSLTREGKRGGEELLPD